VEEQVSSRLELAASQILRLPDSVLLGPLGEELLKPEYDDDLAPFSPDVNEKVINAIIAYNEGNGGFTPEQRRGRGIRLLAKGQVAGLFSRTPGRTINQLTSEDLEIEVVAETDPRLL